MLPVENLRGNQSTVNRNGISPINNPYVYNIINLFQRYPITINVQRKTIGNSQLFAISKPKFREILFTASLCPSLPLFTSEICRIFS